MDVYILIIYIYIIYIWTIQRVPNGWELRGDLLKVTPVQKVTLTVRIGVSLDPKKKATNRLRRCE